MEADEPLVFKNHEPPPTEADAPLACDGSNDTLDRTIPANHKTRSASWRRLPTRTPKQSADEDPQMRTQAKGPLGAMAN